MDEPTYHHIAEVATTQEAGEANALLADGWELLTVGGGDFPTYALGLSRTAKARRDVPPGTAVLGDPF